MADLLKPSPSPLASQALLRSVLLWRTALLELARSDVSWSFAPGPPVSTYFDEAGIDIQTFLPPLDPEVKGPLPRFKRPYNRRMSLASPPPFRPPERVHLAPVDTPLEPDELEHEPGTPERSDRPKTPSTSKKPRAGSRKKPSGTKRKPTRSDTGRPSSHPRSDPEPEVEETTETRRARGSKSTAPDTTVPRSAKTTRGKTPKPGTRRRSGTPSDPTDRRGMPESSTGSPTRRTREETESETNRSDFQEGSPRPRVERPTPETRDKRRTLTGPDERDRDRTSSTRSREQGVERATDPANPTTRARRETVQPERTDTVREGETRRDPVDPSVSRGERTSHERHTTDVAPSTRPNPEEQRTTPSKRADTRTEAPRGERTAPDTTVREPRDPSEPIVEERTALRPGTETSRSPESSTESPSSSSSDSRRQTFGPREILQSIAVADALLAAFLQTDPESEPSTPVQPSHLSSSPLSRERSMAFSAGTLTAHGPSNTSLQSTSRGVVQVSTPEEQVHLDAPEETVPTPEKTPSRSFGSRLKRLRDRAESMRPKNVLARRVRSMERRIREKALREEGTERQSTRRSRSQRGSTGTSRTVQQAPRGRSTTTPVHEGSTRDGALGREETRERPTGTERATKSTSERAPKRTSEGAPRITQPTKSSTAPTSGRTSSPDPVEQPPSTAPRPDRRSEESTVSTGRSTGPTPKPPRDVEVPHTSPRSATDRVHTRSTEVAPGPRSSTSTPRTTPETEAPTHQSVSTDPTAPRDTSSEPDDGVPGELEGSVPSESGQTPDEPSESPTATEILTRLAKLTGHSPTGSSPLRLGTLLSTQNGEEVALLKAIERQLVHATSTETPVHLPGTDPESDDDKALSPRQLKERETIDRYRSERTKKLSRREQREEQEEMQLLAKTDTGRDLLLDEQKARKRDPAAPLTDKEKSERKKELKRIARAQKQYGLSDSELEALPDLQPRLDSEPLRRKLVARAEGSRLRASGGTPTSVQATTEQVSLTGGASMGSAPSTGTRRTVGNPLARTRAVRHDPRVAFKKWRQHTSRTLFKRAQTAITGGGATARPVGSHPSGRPTHVTSGTVEQVHLSAPASGEASAPTAPPRPGVTTPSSRIGTDGPSLASSPQRPGPTGASSKSARGEKPQGKKKKKGFSWKAPDELVRSGRRALGRKLREAASRASVENRERKEQKRRERALRETLDLRDDVLLDTLKTLVSQSNEAMELLERLHRELAELDEIEDLRR